jgi:hypothetical protein
VIVMTHIPDMRSLPTRLMAATNHTAVNNHNMSAPCFLCLLQASGSFCRSVCSSFIPNQFHRSAHAPAHTERQAFVVSMMKIIARALHMAVAVQQQFLLADTGHPTVDDAAVCWAKCSNGSMQPSRSQLLQPPAQSKSDLG